MKRITQSQKVLDYIRATKGWIPSHRLIKVEILGKWIGTNGDRIARQWFEEGKILREHGSKILSRTDAFGEPIEAKYTYYKSRAPKDVVHFYVQGQIVATKEIW